MTDAQTDATDATESFGTSIAEFNRVEAVLAELETEVSPIPDCTTTEGMAEAKARKKPLQKLRTGGNKARLAATGELRDEVKRINSLWSDDILPRLAAMEDPLTDAIKTVEDEQKRKIAEEEARIEREKAEAAVAEQAKLDEERAAIERERAELAAERQRIADEAAAIEHAKQAERDRKDAEARAEAERLAEIDHEKVREAEQKAAAEQAERDTAAAVEKAKADAVREEQERQAEAERKRVAGEEAAEAKRLVAEKREAKKAAARPYVEKLRAWQASIPALPDSAPASMAQRVDIITAMLANIADTVAESEQATEKAA